MHGWLCLSNRADWCLLQKATVNRFYIMRNKKAAKSRSSALVNTQGSVLWSHYINIKYVKKYRRICISSKVANFKNIRLLGSPLIGVPLVNTLTLNIFESIRHFFLSHGERKSLKLTPSVGTFEIFFLSIPVEESPCGDKQICATKVHHLMKYMPKKNFFFQEYPYLNTIFIFILLWKKSFLSGYDTGVNHWVNARQTHPFGEHVMNCISVTIIY